MTTPNPELQAHQANRRAAVATTAVGERRVAVATNVRGEREQHVAVATTVRGERERRVGVATTVRGEQAWDTEEPASSEPSDAAPPTGVEQPFYLGRFIVHRVLGEGGLGIVYAAFDERLEREIAIKLLHGGRMGGALGASSRERLLREARALARLSHPNVVQIHEVGDVGGELYIAMECVRGITLRDWLGEQRASGEVLRMFRAIGQGLVSAHAEGLVHRDFKPENVLIGRDGRPRVADFGLAFAAHTDATDAAPSGDATDLTLTRTGAMVGTPLYMSPEQWQSASIDARSDQYSFCVALYEALYGRPPFEAEQLQALGKLVISEEPEQKPLNGQVSQKLHEVILRGLAKEPAKRWPAMSALLDALSRHAAESSVSRRTRRAIVLFGLANGVLWTAVVLQVQLGTVPRSHGFWVGGASASLAVLFGILLFFRERLRRQPANRRIVQVGVATFVIIWLNRVGALFLDTPFEHIFAYDFAAITVLAMVSSLVMGRWLRVIGLVSAIAFFAAIAMPSYAPMLIVPVVIAMNGLVLYHWWAGHIAQSDGDGR